MDQQVKSRLSAAIVERKDMSISAKKHHSFAAVQVNIVTPQKTKKEAQRIKC